MKIYYFVTNWLHRLTGTSKSDNFITTKGTNTAQNNEGAYKYIPWYQEFPGGEGP